jgi:hypothetical protein
VSFQLPAILLAQTLQKNLFRPKEILFGPKYGELGFNCLEELEPWRRGLELWIVNNSRTGRDPPPGISLEGMSDADKLSSRSTPETRRIGVIGRCNVL